MLKNIRTVSSTRFKKTDFNSFLFFFLFAVVIWIFVQFSKQYNEVLDIPVKYVNVPPDKLLKNDNPQKVKLRMQENGFTIAWFSMFPPTLSIDVSRANENNGQLVYVIDENRSQILEQLNIDFEDNSFVNDALIIEYEQKQEKKLPVIPRVKVEYAAGYSAIGEMQFTPDSVMVSGPDNILDTLSAVYTVPVNLTGVKNDISGIAEIDTTSLDNVSLYESRIRYAADVEKFTEGNVQVPIELINVPEDLNVVIFPKETVLFFQVNLKDFNKVKPADFRVVADFKNVRDNQDFIIPEVVKKPDFTSNLRLSDKRIQFIIKK